MKTYKGYLEIKQDELYLKNHTTKKLVKIPHYCKGAIYHFGCGAYAGAFSFNEHTKEWTFTSWENKKLEIKVGDFVSIYKSN